jgi:hypothetical protein
MSRHVRGSFCVRIVLETIKMVPFSVTPLYPNLKVGENEKLIRIDFTLALDLSSHVSSLRFAKRVRD